MTEREFCYWLQGYFELSGSTNGLTADQVECIRRHLQLVDAVQGKPPETTKKASKDDFYRC